MHPSASRILSLPPALALSVLQRLVDKLRWMSNEVYGELFALGQCMPGPTSTQVSFAVGTIKKGAPGEHSPPASSRLMQWLAPPSSSGSVTGLLSCRRSLWPRLPWLIGVLIQGQT